MGKDEIYKYKFHYFKVHPTFLMKNAHANGSDISCLKFSYDNNIFVSRGGKVVIVFSVTYI